MPPPGARFSERRFLQVLLAAYAVFWILTAVSPRNRADWVAENALVWIALPCFVAAFRRLPLSDRSYLLVVVFFVLHGFGAYYTYERAPLGFWLKDVFHLGRNHYDRIVHFCFGLLLTYPAREIFVRVVRREGFWSYYLPASAVLALSALYEIEEAYVAEYLAPAAKEAFLGMQGDLLDSQRDMTAVLLGAILCMVLSAVLRRIAGRSGAAET